MILLNKHGYWRRKSSLGIKTDAKIPAADLLHARTNLGVPTFFLGQ